MTPEVLRRLAMLPILAAFTASAAWAIPSPYSDSAVCGGDNFRTCASLSITWSGSTATIHIRNVGQQGEVFTAFGFTHLPAGTTITASTVDPRLAGRFEQGTASDIQAVGFVSVPPPTQTGLKMSDNTGSPFHNQFQRPHPGRYLGARFQHPRSVRSGRLLHQAHHCA